MSKTYNSAFYQEWYQQCLKDLCKSSLNLFQHQRDNERKSDSDFSNEAEDQHAYTSEVSFCENKQIEKIHGELSEISRKLQYESKKLNLKEIMLNEKETKLIDIEKKLADYALSLEEIIENSLKKKSHDLEEEYIIKIQKMQEENKKFKKSFQMLKNAGDKMKTKILFDQEKLQQSEEKSISQQNRIINLQRQNDILKQQLKEQETAKTSLHTDFKTEEKTSKPFKGVFISFVGTVLQWVSESHLKEIVQNLIANIRHGGQLDSDVNFDITNERCMKILITFPDLFEYITQQEAQLSILQFTYWSLLHSHLTKSSQKAINKSTLRRIGEQIYNQQQKPSSKSACTKKFFNSDDPHIKLLSCLIILFTITQADILSQAFHCLCIELRTDKVKELFLCYHATFALYPLFKLTNKVNMEYTTDVIMELSSETVHLRGFLESVSNVEWIQAILTVMKSYNTDVKLIEKLSLLLQRISKIRSNKTIFDALQVKDSVIELLRLCKQENIQLNLRSILFNIESMKSRRKCVS